MNKEKKKAGHVFRNQVYDLGSPYVTRILSISSDWPSIDCFPITYPFPITKTSHYSESICDISSLSSINTGINYH